MMVLLNCIELFTIIPILVNLNCYRFRIGKQIGSLLVSLFETASLIVWLNIQELILIESPSAILTFELPV